MTTPCIGCKYANWQKTSNGRLHPNGEGKCTYVFPDMPVLPMSFMWGYSYNDRPPCPKGGRINRTPRFVIGELICPTRESA